MTKFGKKYFKQKEIYRQRANNDFQAHKDEIKQNKEINIIMTLMLETKSREQRNAYHEATELDKSRTLLI